MFYKGRNFLTQYVTFNSIPQDTPSTQHLLSFNVRCARSAQQNASGTDGRCTYSAIFELAYLAYFFVIAVDKVLSFQLTIQSTNFVNRSNLVHNFVICLLLIVK